MDISLTDEGFKFFMTETYTLPVDEESHLQRLDRFLAEKTPFSRSRLKPLIEKGSVTLDGEPVKSPSRKLSVAQIVSVVVPDLEEALPEAQDIPLDVVYEDEDLLVINKQAGLVVHPGAGHPDQTLVNALLAHCGDSLSGIGGVRRPGIVHRLDKGTSGLMVVAKNDQAHQALSAQFSDRTLSRRYLAFVWGTPKVLEGTLETNIIRSPRHRQKMAVCKVGGKLAITHFEVKEVFKPYTSLIECSLETGRTHQIRVHMTEFGHSLLGDPLYGRPARGIAPPFRDAVRDLTDEGTRPALHAYRLRFRHPRTNNKKTFEVPMPEDLLALESFLRNE